MKDITEKNFGVLIAFGLPGFLLLWGLSFSLNDVASWLSKSSASEGPTVAGFLYATLGSLALGLLISAVRWLVVDSILHFYYKRIRSKPLPQINFAKLKTADVFAAFQGIIDNHYRYYQYYSNTLVALVTAFVAYLKFGQKSPGPYTWITVIIAFIALLLASKDSFKKYYVRAAAVTA